MILMRIPIHATRESRCHSLRASAAAAVVLSLSPPSPSRQSCRDRDTGCAKLCLIALLWPLLESLFSSHLISARRLVRASRDDDESHLISISSHLPFFSSPLLLLLLLLSLACSLSSSPSLFHFLRVSLLNLCVSATTTGPGHSDALFLSSSLLSILPSGGSTAIIGIS